MNTKLTYLVEAIVLVIVFPYFFSYQVWFEQIPHSWLTKELTVIAIITID